MVLEGYRLGLKEQLYPLVALLSWEHETSRSQFLMMHEYDDVYLMGIFLRIGIISYLPSLAVLVIMNL